MKTPTTEPVSLGLRLLLGLLGVGLLAVALWSCIAVLPPRLYPPLTNQDLAGLTRAERAERIEGRSKLQNDARTTLLQGLAALLVLGGAGLGAWATLRQVRISRVELDDARKRAENEAQQARDQLDVAQGQLEVTERQARDQLEVARQQLQEAERQARDQLALAEQGQITDRFTRAVEQLDASRSLAVRLGGLYALERIARDSRADRATVAEVLCAYVRTASREPQAVAEGISEGPDAASIQEAEAAEPMSLTGRAPDVQVAVTILGRWEQRLGEAPAELDLHGADLRGADLPGAQLQGANLEKAQLQWARLAGAQLQRARLGRAQLQHADLRTAQLGGATLQEAQLQHALLLDARLQHADLTDARLRRAKLIGVWLEEAVLDRADLQYANIGHAHLKGVKLRKAQLQDANLRRTDLRGAHLREAQLEDADLLAAKLQDADLSGANLSGALLQDAYLKGVQWQGATASMRTFWPSAEEQRIAEQAGVRFERP
jgi:uncharacterized protein YjbI with pentapeptide repeats